MPLNRRKNKLRRKKIHNQKQVESQLVTLLKQNQYDISFIENIGRTTGFPSELRTKLWLILLNLDNEKVNNTLHAFTSL